MRTIVEQTLEKLDLIFSEELDKPKRKDKAINVKKLNKSKIKKEIYKNRKKKRDSDTLEQRARDKAIRDTKKDLLNNTNVKDVGGEPLSKKMKIEDRLETSTYQSKLEKKTKKNMRDMVKKEKDKNNK